MNSERKGGGGGGRKRGFRLESSSTLFRIIIKVSLCLSAPLNHVMKKRIGKTEEKEFDSDFERQNSRRTVIKS